MMRMEKGTLAIKPARVPLVCSYLLFSKLRVLFPQPHPFLLPAARILFDLNFLLFLVFLSVSWVISDHSFLMVILKNAIPNLFSNGGSCKFMKMLRGGLAMSVLASTVPIK